MTVAMLLVLENNQLINHSSQQVKFAITQFCTKVLVIGAHGSTQYQMATKLMMYWLCTVVYYVPIWTASTN